MCVYPTVIFGDPQGAALREYRKVSLCALLYFCIFDNLLTTYYYVAEFSNQCVF